jgi:membrane peptidoglycan carboxypeptidase
LYDTGPQPGPKMSIVLRVGLPTPTLAIGVVLLWSLASLILLAARGIDPPSTAVHIQRRLQVWIHHTPYHARYKFIPLSQISPDLQHAVNAAEDAGFYQHHGFDWHEIQMAQSGTSETENWVESSSRNYIRTPGRRYIGYLSCTPVVE